jgi:hypothetical protein
MQNRPLTHNAAKLNIADGAGADPLKTEKGTGWLKGELQPPK